MEFLRTPSPSHPGDEGRYVTASWGSPYPQSDRPRFRSLSVSSGPSEDSPIHQLEIHTPFLRPAPFLPDAQEPQQPASLVSAAVLANRARRPARGLTEDWIRQHTAGGVGSEASHWLSDGTGDSENSSLSGSVSGDDAAWLEKDLRTPRAARGTLQQSPVPPRRHPRKRSSIETLKQADVSRLNRMASADVEKVTPDGASEHTATDSLHDSVPTPSTPKGSVRSGKTGGPRVGFDLPQTPSRSPGKKEAPMTPRLKKKVPWKGKNIMILLPRDDGRGRPGKAPMPMTQAATAGMLRSWSELGYNIGGFDLDGSESYSGVESHAMSRGLWPSTEDMSRERREKIKVFLPDLKGEYHSRASKVWR